MNDPLTIVYLCVASVGALALLFVAAAVPSYFRAGIRREAATCGCPPWVVVVVLIVAFVLAWPAGVALYVADVIRTRRAG